MSSTGLHHITAVTGDIRRCHDFYTRVLGLRLVKKTVNFDDPASWHLYFGDARGAPGSALTFFSAEGEEPGRAGAGEVVTIGFSIPKGSALFWTERMADEGVTFALDAAGAAHVIVLHDPDGISLELIEEAAHDARLVHATAEIGAEHAIRGLAGATLLVNDPDATGRILTDVFGWKEIGRSALPGFERRRFSARGGDGLGRRIDLLKGDAIEPGAPGAGVIHHIAFRAADEIAQAEMAAALRKLGVETTPQLDRSYFRSIYFREPSGVLFEIATDGPGFATDESVETLGESLMLPPQLEARRAEIEAKLPPL